MNKKINVITVLGANGTMGCNVAGIFASFGNAKVYMISRSLQDAKTAKKKAATSVRAETISSNLIPKTYDDLEMCVAESDLVFESVAEDLEIKKSIYQRMSAYIKPDTIIGSGTSGLSINALSGSLTIAQKERFLGIHFYNPPYSMTLCEVIPSDATAPNILQAVKAYLTNVLFRDVVEVRDEPAFMGNRVGFQFINEALQMAVKYKEKGGIDYIDAMLGGFTGRMMPPLVTTDFVGLDVHKAIVDNVYNNTKDYAHETFVMPEFVKKLIRENKLGRKTGAGLYRLKVDEDGIKTKQVFDIETDKYRDITKYSFEFATQMQHFLKIGQYDQAIACLVSDTTDEGLICSHFLIKYVIYSLYISKAIGEDIHSADRVMATGFNWIPPLALIDAFGGKEQFRQIVNIKMSKEYLESVDVEDALNGVVESKLDYRSFFKAK